MNFGYGELGYNSEGDFEAVDQAIEAAVNLSNEKGLTAICVWDEYDVVHAVVIDGEIFDKRTY